MCESVFAYASTDFLRFCGKRSEAYVTNKRTEFNTQKGLKGNIG